MRMVVATEPLFAFVSKGEGKGRGEVGCGSAVGGVGGGAAWGVRMGVTTESPFVRLRRWHHRWDNPSS